LFQAKILANLLESGVISVMQKAKRMISGLAIFSVSACFNSSNVHCEQQASRN